ncbi:HEAT repeat domain-containing protein [candidate division KSB1 bacterium]|nr:HEAT repeat domain-containing protein [candidate division KSB1 bacterium]
MSSIVDSNARENVLEHKLEDSGNYEPSDIETASAWKRDKSLKTDFLNIDHELEALFQAYANGDFEDGMESEFISELISSIRIHGTKAIEAIRRIVLEQNVKPLVAFEALRWLGRVVHPESYRSRLFFLETCLDSPFRLVRDGAALGLASMKDTHAIPYLREAIAQEKIQDLRKDLEAVLLRLENLSNATISVDDK